jgi:hypothetical protein
VLANLHAQQCAIGRRRACQDGGIIAAIGYPLGV